MTNGPQAAREYRVDTYRVSDVGTGERSRDGKAYTKVTLDNANGRFLGMIWPESGVDCPIASASPLEVCGYHRTWGDRRIIDVEAIELATPDSIQNGAALLPRHQCPERARKALDRLVAFNATLEPYVLRQFLTRALLDPQIGPPLLTARAAKSYHHAYPGGLLVHSVEMLDWVAESAATGLLKSPYAAPVAQLGYLFHDIGKVCTLGSAGRPHAGRVLRHEFMNVLLLAPHLQWLESRWCQGALALKCILDFCAIPAAKRGIGKWLGADIVIWADQLSAGSSNGAGESLIRIEEPPHEIVHWDELAF